MPGNKETCSREILEGERGIVFVTLALKPCTGDAGGVNCTIRGIAVGLICECEVEGRELCGLLGLLQALTTEDHSLGCMNVRVELDVDGLELAALQSSDTCLLALNVGGTGLRATGLEVYCAIVSWNWWSVEGNRCILPENPHATVLPALQSDANALRMTEMRSSVMSSLFCSIVCLAISATRFPS
jgi:hypothetical protein